MFVYIMDGVEAALNLPNNRVIFLENCHVITDFASLGRHYTGFPLRYILRNNVKVTFVDFTEESTSISVKFTCDTSVIEIDMRLYQYSSVHLIKRQEKGKILVLA